MFEFLGQSNPGGPTTHRIIIPHNKLSSVTLPAHRYRHISSLFLPDKLWLLPDRADTCRWFTGDRQCINRVRPCIAASTQI